MELLEEHIDLRASRICPNPGNVDLPSQIKSEEISATQWSEVHGACVSWKDLRRCPCSAPGGFATPGSH